jgi:hypothetical protein
MEEKGNIEVCAKDIILRKSFVVFKWFVVFAFPFHEPRFQLDAAGAYS